MITLEVRLPILPEPGFYSNVKLAALSLARLGEFYADAPLTVSCGGHTAVASLEAANPWANTFPTVGWKTVMARQSDDPFASGLNRFLDPARTDVVILMDADACLLKPVDGLLEQLGRSKVPMVAGVQAHFPPHVFHAVPEKNAAFWQDLFKKFGLEDIPLNCDYSQLNRAKSGGSPPYFNYGFIALNALAFEQIAPLIEPLTRQCIAQADSKNTIFFAAQIALTIAILKSKVEVLTLGPEYNCANSDEMFGHGLQDADDVCVLHYLRKDVFDRHQFLCCMQAFEQFKTTMFSSPVNQVFQRHISGLEDVFYSA